MEKTTPTRDGRIDALAESVWTKLIGVNALLSSMEDKLFFQLCNNDAFGSYKKVVHEQLNEIRSILDIASCLVYDAEKQTAAAVKLMGQSHG